MRLREGQGYRPIPPCTPLPYAAILQAHPNQEELMGIAGDPFYCRSWEPNTREQEERLERWLKEVRESVRAREASRETAGPGPGCHD